MEDFTKRMNQELHKQEVLLAAQRDALNSKLLSINSQHLDKEKQEVKNIAEPTAKHQTRISPCLKNFKVNHKESIIPLNKTPQISSVNAITPDLSTENPRPPHKCGMRNLAHSEKESDEFIKSGGVIDEIDAFLDMDISTDIENGYHDSEEDIIYLESLLIDDTSPNLPPKDSLRSIETRAMIFNPPIIPVPSIFLLLWNPQS
ncbi:hypothetical protein Tco_0185262 [Tanacetum coccineum]